MFFYDDFRYQWWAATLAGLTVLHASHLDATHANDHAPEEAGESLVEMLTFNPPVASGAISW